MKEVITKLKLICVSALTRQVLVALDNARLQIEAQALKFSGTQLPPLREESQAIAERFMHKLNSYFDNLAVHRITEQEIDDYGNLSLVDHDYLEAIIAMEGMVNHARNCDIQQYISFTTRLGTVFPNLQIDESNNPLDPEQIGASFSDAIRPLGLKAHYLLTIYREFNKAVFHNLEDVLADANEVMIGMGILSNLDIKARNRELQKTKRAINRPATDRETRAFSDPVAAEQEKSGKNNAEMFAMMQTLVQGLANTQDAVQVLPVSATATASALPGTDTGHEFQKQQALLLEVLSNIQSSLEANKIGDPLKSADAASGSIKQSISENLQAESKSGKIGPLDSQSADVINLVTLLYEAIWKDESLPIVMKELIGRTQISIMKIALTDITFFDDEQHPARVILNEFAMAGIAWTEKALLQNDTVYLKIKELVERILAEPTISNTFLQGLINELRQFKNSRGKIDAGLEQRIRESGDHNDRLDDVRKFVTQKIDERILNDNLDPSIRTLLHTNFHDFLVKLVLKEGPGGSSWKPVMSTIDVLLWTVKTEKQPGDKDRFEKINPRLIDNLEKALQIGGTSKTRITKIIRQLKQVQEFSFHEAETIAKKHLAPSSSDVADASSDMASATAKARMEPPPLPRDDPHLRQVDKFPIGIWLEFKGAAGQPVRCTLAAKIDSIDKMFFVNHQGVKVVELTRMRLARELKAGSVRIVSEGSLVDRAMESVISNLRNSARAAN